MPRFALRLGRTMCAAVVLWVAAAFASAANPPQQLAAASYIKQAVYQYRRGRYASARSLALAQLRQRQYVADAYEILGWSEYQLGNYERALSAFRRLASAAPRSVDAAIGRGWANFKLGHFGIARRHFMSASSRARRDQRYMVADGLGWIAFVEGRYADAERRFRSFARQRKIARYPQDRALGLGWIALAKGNLGLATDIFSAALGEGDNAAGRATKFGIRVQPDYFRLDDALGRIALIRGNYAEARRHALRGLSKTRFNLDLFYLLDAALEREGSPEQAIETYRRLAKKTPGIPEFHSGMGWHALRAGRLRLAERSFLIALQMRPDFEFAMFGLTKARDRMNAAVSDAWRLYLDGDYEPALAAFDRHVAKLGNTNPAVHTGRGWSLLALGKLDAAAGAFKQALKVDPYFKLAREGEEAQRRGYMTAYLLGWDLLAKKQFGKARRQFDRANASAPKAEHWRIAEAMAWLEMSRGNLDRAEKTFTTILDDRSDAYLSRKGLGFLEAKRGNLVKAMWLIDRSVREKPDQVLASYTIPAKAMLDAGKSRYALRLITFGLRAHPDDPTLKYQAARGFAQLGDWPKAMSYLMQAIDQAPAGIDRHIDSFPLPAAHAAKVYLALAWGLYRHRKFDAAIRRFQQARADGASVEATRGIGFALFRLGRYRAAIPALTIAARAEPETLKPVREVVRIPGTKRWWPIQYNAASTLAWSLYRLGNYETAASQFRLVLKTYPTSIDALSGLGWSLLATGDRLKAQRRFKQAILLSPGYPDAWQGLDRAEKKSAKQDAEAQ